MLRPGRLALLLALVPAIARAERPEGVCVEVSVDFTPASAMQIVAWLETPDGTYVDTLYVTQKTGRFGLGNRPGRADFNTGSETGDTFPYGRRIQTFPVWANRHGMDFPAVVFQNGDENNLSHPLAQSSPETAPPYCRPLQPSEAEWDTGTCASSTYSDKGMLSATLTTKYPPRSDVTRRMGVDTPDVDLYRALNPFDAVSQATPPGGSPATVTWAAPQTVDYGSYVLFVEASKTYDFNATYNDTTFPSPTGIAWAEYGKAWRGQPSVVYQVPFTVADVATRALTASYAGYGDPTGQAGTLNPPDATITTDTPGSGASRMQLVSDGAEIYRVRVRTRPEFDMTPPSQVTEVTPVALGSRSVTVSWFPAGDDGTTGAAAGYDVRVRAGSPITADNFVDSMPVSSVVTYDRDGLPSIAITGLLPETEYWIGVRAYDNCFNRSPVAALQVTTLDREVGEVDWCFIATAAYGSRMANDVVSLRQFRDALLSSSVLGQLAVSTYYTFGPAVSGVVGESDLLRATARALLAPVVHAVRSTSY
jgi:hypothetical protein